jgi:hypothetical protein
MKKQAIALLAFLGVFNSAFAGGNSCATILCLGGEMDGAMGGEMCDKPIQDYFDIKEYRGAEYAPDLTLESRIEYLDECPEDTTTKMRINAKYGMIPDNPFPKN